MASIRSIKRDIDYLVSEVITDSYLAIHFHPEKRERAIKVIEDAVAFRNELIDRANNPAEKNNPHLVKRHYNQLRRDLLEGVDKLFGQVSDVCK